MPDDDTPATADDLALLTEAAHEAADIALGFFRRAPRVWHKANASPVSEADIAVDRFLKERLTGERPDYGWLSEETEDGSDRLGRRRLFVVDPIDGTRGYLAGSDQWTISLAVVEAGRPVTAALLQPTIGRLYTATAGGGAFADGAALSLPAAATLAGARVAGPAAMIGRLRGLEPTVDPRGYIASLALRIAMVADRSIDVAFSKPNAHDWDIAAADLILTEAGGVLVGSGGRSLVYNRPAAIHGALVGTGAALARKVAAMLAPAGESGEPA